MLEGTVRLQGSREEQCTEGRSMGEIPADVPWTDYSA